MHFGSGMDGAAIDGRQNAPTRIMDAGGGNRPMRIAHGGEIAVVGRAYPTLTWQVRAILARRQIAGHGINGCGGEAGFKALAIGCKTFAIEYRIVVGPCAEAVLSKGGLVRVDKCHALGWSI